MSSLFIGYDIGTKTVKVAYGNSLSDYKSIKIEHYSDPQGTIANIEQKINGGDSTLTGYITGRYRESIDRRNNRLTSIDWTKPVIKYCNDNYNNGIRFIIDIGAAGLSLLELKEGRFHRFQTNSICASGTGSFLDQQMIRMGLNFEKVDRMKITDRVPTIASRCAVFAKSDLIHRQQEGFSVEELWNGLVKGMAESCFITLLRGDNITGKILMIGGLIKNRLFLHYFSQLLEKDTLLIPDEPDTFLARCCLNYALNNNEESALDNDERKQNSKQNTAYELPLFPGKTEKIKYFLDDYGNERTVYESLKKIVSSDSFVTQTQNTDAEINYPIPVVIGVDIGSTSTKAALLHYETGDILLSYYRKTQGNPILAYQNILKGINSYTKDNKVRFDVKGMGTTGSGRKIVGAFAGADQCINEITAHLKGGLRETANVRTIFEIGGQDSKYILVENGWMKDANMNYVCAAGTGSFLEEQAQNLNIGLDDFEDLCRGIPAPKTNDRCTVFMEQDSKKLIVEGHSKSEVVASLLYSVCRNYLHRVVQNRPIEEPILFLGATARNKGLVQAFSNIVQKEIFTSPNSHLTGAIGVAEIVRGDNIRRDNESTSSEDSNKTFFKGFALDSITIEFKERICKDCHNNCRIIYFESQAGTVSWGYQCGKEGVDKVLKSQQQEDKTDYFQKFYKLNHPYPQYVKPGKSTKTIHIPKILSYFSHNYLWQIFWQELGYDVVNLPDSNKEIASAALNYSPNEICFPLKIAIGHIIYALKNKKLPIFTPYLIKDIENKATSNSYFCPMTQSIPAIVKNILVYNGLSVKEIYSPVVDLSKSNEDNISSLWGYFDKKLHIPRQDIKRAFLKALDGYKKLQENVYNEGKSSFENLSKNVPVSLPDDEHTQLSALKPVLVVMGRAYNLFDSILNLGLIKDAKSYGYTIIPADLVPVKRENIGERYQNMYWSYGQKIITIAEELMKYPNFYPIFLTNFNCGPDSFILSMLEDIWKDKPYLILELDEHSGNAGYLTRVEAFLDRIKGNQQNVKTTTYKIPAKKTEESTKKRDKYQTRKPLLIPPMNPKAAPLFSGAIRSAGINAIALTREDINTFQLGKSYLRGSECLPAASTLGSIFDYILEKHPQTSNKKETSDPSYSVFMPCASGPCRFGQYGFLHQMVMERHNIDIDILSVNSENNYAGFSSGLRMQLFRSLILTDILTKLSARLRPYEKKQGEVDELLNRYLVILANALEKKERISTHLKNLKRAIDKLEIDWSNKKPLVGIVGEIYVRMSPFSNDYLIDKIENSNAESWLTPFMEWLHYTGYLKRSADKTKFAHLKNDLASRLIDNYESRYYDYFQEILKDRREPDVDYVMNRAKPYISEAIQGEAILTVGRTICFIEQGASMIVNVAPFGCMPGTISSIILKNIALEYSTPIVSLYYDGFVGFDVQLDQYLCNLRNPKPDKKGNL